MAGLVRHWFLFLDMPLYLWLVWFGTDHNFQDITCTHSHFGSARMPLSGISPVLTATSVRHGCSFPNIPLYSQPLRFGTRTTFQDITCTHGHFGSALVPLSRISPVLMATLIRHSCHFPEYHLYSWPLWFGTCATFRNITCTHDDFVRHWLSFSDMPCTLQLQ